MASDCFRGIFDSIVTVDSDKVFNVLLATIFNTTPAKCSVAQLFDSFINSPIKPVDRAVFCDTWILPIAGLSQRINASDLLKINTPESLAVLDALIISKRIQMTGDIRRPQGVECVIDPLGVRVNLRKDIADEIKAEILGSLEHYKAAYDSRYAAQEMAISMALIAFADTLPRDPVEERRNYQKNAIRREKEMGSLLLDKWIPIFLAEYADDKELVAEILISILKLNKEEQKNIVKMVYKGGNRKKSLTRKRKSRTRKCKGLKLATLY